MDLRGLGYFIAVAEERHVGRAAARLHMTQPPLSRAMNQLEADLGVQLLERTPHGVALTPAGKVLLEEARALHQRSERLRARVRDAAGDPRLTIGSLADTADLVGTRLVAPFRARHPHVSVSIHEFDLTDPTAGLRAGSVDIALTRTPFTATGLRTALLVRQPIGVVVHQDDPLADPVSGHGTVSVDQLSDRRWVRLPENSDPVWLAYWMGPAPDTSRPAVRTISECVQSVLWDGLTALAPLDQLLPPGLTVIPVDDREPSDLVLAWRAADRNPIVSSFVEIAAHGFRSRSARRPGRRA